MTPEKQAELAKGRAEAEARRDVEARERVERFRDWCRAGSPSHSIPIPMPNDNDYARARRAGLQPRR